MLRLRSLPAAAAELSASHLRAAVAFGAAFLGLVLMVALGWLRPLDLALGEATRAGLPCWALNASDAASLLLAGEVSLVYVGLLALVCLWRRRPLVGLVLVGLLLASVALEFLFKFSFYQPAPHVLLINLDRPECVRPPFLEYPLSGVVVPNTFPSGYAVRAAYFGLLLTALLRQRWPRLAKTAAPLLLFLAILLSATRVAIAWHWTTDVLGGLLLGAAAASLALALANNFRWLRPVSSQ